MKEYYLIIGQGDIGRQVAKALTKQGKNVLAISRTPKDGFDHHGNFAHWAMDTRELVGKVHQLQHITHIAIIVAPNQDNADRVQAYQACYGQICQAVATLANHLPALRWVLFVSSTSVYGQDNGVLIDERTLAKPSKPTAKILCDAENIIRQAFGDKAIIVRPSGIYGKNRQRMIRLAKTAHIDGVPQSHLTNRIMDVDLVRVLTNILTNPQPKPLYLATDFCPVVSCEVLAYLCQLAHYPQPKVLPSDTTGKKIISNLPPSWLKFADYRQGYAWILQE